MGHKTIIDSFVKNGKPVVIAVRESEEIYPAWLRVEMIKAEYQEEYDKGLVEVIRIPDIEGVAIGRDVGYYLVEVPDDIKKISGTNIRAGLSTEIPEHAQRILDQHKVWEEFKNDKLNDRRDKGDNS